MQIGNQEHDDLREMTRDYCNRRNAETLAEILTKIADRVKAVEEDNARLRKQVTEQDAQLAAHEARLNIAARSIPATVGSTAPATGG